MFVWELLISKVHTKKKNCANSLEMSNYPSFRFKNDFGKGFVIFHNVCCALLIIHLPELQHIQIMSFLPRSVKNEKSELSVYEWWVLWPVKWITYASQFWLVLKSKITISISHYSQVFIYHSIHKTFLSWIQQKKFAKVI